MDEWSVSHHRQHHHRHDSHVYFDDFCLRLSLKDPRLSYSFVIMEAMMFENYFTNKTFSDFVSARLPPHNQQASQQLIFIGHNHKQKKPWCGIALDLKVNEICAQWSKPRQADRLLEGVDDHYNDALNDKWLPLNNKNIMVMKLWCWCWDERATASCGSMKELRVIITIIMSRHNDKQTTIQPNS